MATSNKSKKILEKARKIAAKTKKKKVSKVDVKKKTTSYPEGQNAPQSKKYTQESDKTLSAKATGWRWTKEGAKKLGKSVESKPTTSDIEKYRNETFKLKGKPNKSGPKGVGDGSHRYLYVERRADKADITRKNKLAKGGIMNRHIWEGWTVENFIDELSIEFNYHPKFKSRDEVKKWAMENQPYYKKYIPEVVDYYWEKNQREKYEDGGEMAKGGKTKKFLTYYEVYDENTDKTLNIQAYSFEEAEEIASTIEYDNFKDGEDIEYGEMAKGGKIPSSEVADFKKYVKSNYGKDEIWSEFFPPVGVSNEEINHAVSQYIDYCKTKDDQWGGGDTFDREIVRDIMLYNRGTKKGLEYQRAIKEIFGKDKKEYGGILQPMIGGVNADPRFDIYNTTMFAKKGAEVPHGEKEQVKFFEIVNEIKNLEYDGDPKDRRLHSESRFYWGANNEDDYDEAIKQINQIGIKGKGWEIYATYDVSGYDYWMKTTREPNYIHIVVSFDKQTVHEDEIGKIESALYEAIMDAERISNAFDYDPSTSDDDEYANGGNLKVVPIYLYEVTYSKHGKKGTFVSKVKAKSEEDAINKWIDETNRTEGVYTIIDVVKSTRTRMEKGGEMAKGGKTKKAKVEKVDNSSLVRYAQTNDQLKVLTDIIPTLNKKGIKLSYGTSIGKSPQTIIFDKDYHDGILYISPDGWYGTNTYHDEEFSDADDLEYVIDNPSDDDDYAKGGSTHEQGYDDREDESLAMRHGKIASKDFVGSHKRKEHSRRDDAHFETRHKKAYGGLTDSSIELLD